MTPRLPPPQATQDPRTLAAPAAAAPRQQAAAAARRRAPTANPLTAALPRAPVQLRPGSAGAAAAAPRLQRKQDRSEAVQGLLARRGREQDALWVRAALDRRRRPRCKRLCLPAARAPMRGRQTASPRSKSRAWTHPRLWRRTERRSA